MLRWGMIGYGAICAQIAAAAQMTPEMEFVGVYGRDYEKAKAFAARVGIDHVYAKLEDMLCQDVVDVVYIGVPHNVHEDYVIRCIDAGIPVVCEKPLSYSSASARRMTDYARKKHVFLMEAMWSRTFPGMQQILHWLPRIGKLSTIQAAFGFRAGVPTAENRHFDPNRAGGALLDLAVYPLSLMRQVTKMQPCAVTALSRMSPLGCDQAATVCLRYPDGCMATVHVSFDVDMQGFTLYGDKGNISIQPDFWSPTHIVLTTDAGIETYRDETVLGCGYQYELSHVCACVSAGMQGSPLVPPEETVEVLEVLDEIRKQIGLQYPFEVS